jgi:hypothetical protein
MDFVSGYGEYKFNDMVTITGSKLPEFSKVPAIIQYSSYGLELIIKDVTKDGFKGSMVTANGDDERSTEFGLIIFENE